MKSLLQILGALLFLFSAAPAQEPALTRGQGVQPHEGIDAIYRQFSRGYTELDASLVSGLYTAEALYMAPGAEIQKGRASIQRTFDSFFQAAKSEGTRLAVSFEILERAVAGDLAYDAGIYTLTNSRTGQEPGSTRGKFLVVMKKEPDGRWRFQVDSFSGLKEPQVRRITE